MMLAVADLSAAALDGPPRAVLWALAWHHSDETHDAFPSLATLARETGFGRATVIRALTRLQADGWIETFSAPGRQSRIVVQTAKLVNYNGAVPTKAPVSQSNPYQSDTRISVIPLPSHSDTGRGGDPSQRVTRTNEKTNKKESKSQDALRAPTPAPSADQDARGTRLREDWRPSEADAALCRELGLSARETFLSFRDYWTAVPGAKGRKLDWPATWRNWCRREAKSRGSKPGDPAARPGYQAGIV